MLVLERQYHESIFIGKDIKITIVSIRENKVRIGIEAPDNVDIWREEVFDKINAGIEKSRRENG